MWSDYWCFVCITLLRTYRGGDLLRVHQVVFIIDRILHRQWCIWQLHRLARLPIWRRGLNMLWRISMIWCNKRCFRCGGGSRRRNSSYALVYWCMRIVYMRRTGHDLFMCIRCHLVLWMAMYIITCSTTTIIFVCDRKRFYYLCSSSNRSRDKRKWGSR